MVPGVFFGETKMRLQLLSYIAKLLGIQFHFEGLPYGGRRRATVTGDEKPTSC